MGGSALGAVRHKGFIPWDDDIDIAIFRDDYNKLLSLRGEIQQDKQHDILSLGDEGYYACFAKIIDTNTTILERKECPFVVGVYVDIFPLDCFDCSDEQIDTLQRKYNKLMHRYSCSVYHYQWYDFIKYFFKLRKGTCIHAFHSLFYRNRKKYLKELLDFEKTCTAYSDNDKRGEKCVILNEPGRIYETKWFEDTIEVPFEDTTTIVPKKYDEYLTTVYGDWRTPPPKDKQVSNHLNCRYYVNLNEHLTLKQIKQRIRNNNT